MNLYNDFTKWEASFDGQAAIDWTRNHGEIPVFAVGLYLWFIFYFPKMQEWGYLPNVLVVNKKLFAGWNACLSIFSIIGASRVVPHLVHELTDVSYGATFNERFLRTVCDDPNPRYRDGAVGLWVCLFIYSKFPELLDTVFLVIQKKKVIFLHWFHHTTVLMYCWHAYHNSVAQGIWFAAMNLSVHSIMYFYYFMGAVGLRQVVRPFAPLITTIQILQMVGGIAVTVTAALHHDMNDPTACSTDAANWKMGLGMYSVYCGLFVVLFSNLYCTRKDKNKGQRGVTTAQTLLDEIKTKSKMACSTGLLSSTYNPALDIGDAVGNFHGHEFQHNGDSSVELQSPKKKTKSIGSIANVCAVESVGEEEEEVVVPPQQSSVVRRSTRQRKATKKL